jgi:hypothetical protein
MLVGISWTDVDPIKGYSDLGSFKISVNLEITGCQERSPEIQKAAGGCNAIHLCEVMGSFYLRPMKMVY